MNSQVQRTMSFFAGPNCCRNLSLNFSDKQVQMKVHLKSRFINQIWILKSSIFDYLLRSCHHEKKENCYVAQFIVSVAYILYFFIF